MCEKRQLCRVRVDFQNSDTAGRVRLNTVGTFLDLESQGIELKEGCHLYLVDWELHATGRVTFNAEEDTWVAEVDWNEVVSDSDQEEATQSEQ